jgi:hypothetical protein
MFKSSNNLFFIPYFLYLADDQDVLGSMSASLSSPAVSADSVPFFGHKMDMSLLSVEHFSWVVKQMFRIEYTVAGLVRPAVMEYLEAIRRKCDPIPPRACTRTSRRNLSQIRPLC